MVNPDSSETISIDKEGTCSGTLKTKSVFGTWHRYYFVLHEGSLFRFKSAKDYQHNSSAREEINLVGKHTQVIDGVGLTGKKNSIAILREGASPMVLLAATDDDCKMWIKMLRRHAHCDDGGTSGQDSSPTDTVVLLEAFNDATVVSDEKGVISGFNAAAEKLFGWKKSEIVGRNVSELMQDTYAKYHDRYLARYNATGDRKLIGVPRAFVAKRRDGAVIPVILSLGEVEKDGKKNFIGVFKESTPAESSAYGFGCPVALPVSASTASLPAVASSIFDSPNGGSGTSTASCPMGFGKKSGSGSSPHDFGGRMGSYGRIVNTSPGGDGELADDPMDMTPMSSVTPYQVSSFGNRNQSRGGDLSSVIEDKDEQPEHVLPPPANMGDMLHMGRIKLTGQMDDMIERFKSMLGTEFSELLRQYSRMQRTIEVLELENKRLQEEVDQKSQTIAHLEDTMASTLQTSERFSCIQILSNDSTFKFFLDFCRSMACAEQCLFWKDVQNFKKAFRNVGQSVDDMRREAKTIYNKYLDPTSPMELNTTLELRSAAKNMLDRPSVGMFDILADEVLGTLHQNCFEPFVRTGTGKAALALIQSNKSLY